MKTLLRGITVVGEPETGQVSAIISTDGLNAASAILEELSNESSALDNADERRARVIRILSACLGRVEEAEEIGVLEAPVPQGDTPHELLHGMIGLRTENGARVAFLKDLP
jgi:hypothetical protein